MMNRKRADRLFRGGLFGAAFLIPAVLLGMLLSLGIIFFDEFSEIGFQYFFSSDWDPVNERYGIIVFVVGTFLTMFLALGFSIPFSLAISIFTGEIMYGTKIATLISQLLSIISAIPSVVMGLCGLFVLTPIMQDIQLALGYPPYGTGFLSASMVLAIMILPFSAFLGREVISLVPKDLKEAAYGLGATRLEVIRYVILPYAKSGIISGFMISMSRAIGETIAVTMLIGNSNYFPQNIFGTTNTMASVMANEFSEAGSDVYFSAIVGIGFSLIIISALFSLTARKIIKNFY